MLDSFSTRRRRYLIAATLAAALGVAGIAAVVLSGRHPPPDVAVPDVAVPDVAVPDVAVPDVAVPIVVVPGYGGDTGSVATLASRLRSLGRPVRVVEMPARGTGPIAGSARVLARAVSALGADRVDLVGYSAGGVVIRLWAAELDERGVARRIVTLGSPHHGATLAADLGALSPADCRGACAELRPGSQLLRDLNADDETPGEADWTAVWTSGDQTVTPPESARLGGAANIRVQDLCAGTRVSHGGLVRDPVPLEITLAAVEGHEPATSC